MSELWVPNRSRQPDVTNLYDMMVGFQSEIDKTDSALSTQSKARFAVSALRLCLDKLDEAEKQISLVTNLAVVKDSMVGKLGITKRIGMCGLIEGIQCVDINNLLPYSLALSINAVNVFEPDDPDDISMVLNYANVPINCVHYIETVRPARV